MDVNGLYRRFSGTSGPTGLRRSRPTAAGSTSTWAASRASTRCSRSGRPTAATSRSWRAGSSTSSSSRSCWTPAPATCGSSRSPPPASPTAGARASPSPPSTCSRPASSRAPRGPKPASTVRVLLLSSPPRLPLAPQPPTRLCQTTTHVLPLLIRGPCRSWPRGAQRGGLQQVLSDLSGQPHGRRQLQG